MAGWLAFVIQLAELEIAFGKDLAVKRDRRANPLVEILAVDGSVVVAEIHAHPESRANGSREGFVEFSGDLCGRSWQMRRNGAARRYDRTVTGRPYGVLMTQWRASP